MQTIMYAVVRNTYHRRELKDGSFKNVETCTESIYYTSKNKAIDRAKSLASLVSPYNIQLSYNLHKEGKTKHYMDCTIKIDEYRECEGKLQYEDTYYLLTTDRGNILPETRMKEKVFFESI